MLSDMTKLADLPLENEDRIQNGLIYTNLFHNLCETKVSNALKAS